MTVDDKIRDKNATEAIKIVALSSGKIRQIWISLRQRNIAFWSK